jgi:hypothetical protein
MNRWVRLALVAAIAAHAIELYQFTSFGFDKVNHIAATVSWLAGRGFTIPDSGPGGLPQTVYRPLFGFPPGYALALAPLLKVSGDFWWSAYALDLAAAAAFLFAWALIVRHATKQPLAIVGLLLIWTVLYSPAVNTYSDLLAVALFSASVATGMIASSRRPLAGALPCLFSGLLMGMTCAVRYAYWPLASVAPAAFVIARRNRTAWLYACVHAATSACFIGATAWFMRRTTGEATFLGRWYPAPGFFWSQLRTLRAFPADASGLDRVLDRLAVGRPVLEAWTPPILWGIAAILAVVLWRGYLGQRVRLVVQRRLDPDEAFFVAAGVVTVAATAAMIGWLTIRLHALADGWTVGQESRYYLPALPFITCWLWLAAFRGGAGDAANARRLAIALLAVSLAITLPFRALRMQQYFAKNIHTAWLSSERRHDASIILSAIDSISDGRVPPILVDDDLKWRRYVATMGGALAVTTHELAGCSAASHPGTHTLVAMPVAARGTSDSTIALLAGRAGSTRIATTEEVDLFDIVGPICDSATAVR